jgi:hypothetical protein
MNNLSALTLTRISGPPDAILTKVLTLEQNGTITKTHQPSFSEGRADVIELTALRDIETIVSLLQPNQCLSTGIFDQPSCAIVPRRQLTPEQEAAGVRTRTLDHMRQPSHGIVLFDIDFSPYAPAHFRHDSITDLMSVLCDAVPLLRGVAYSGSRSTSAGVFNVSTGECYPGGGWHIFINVLDVDLSALRKYLEVKLWHAGLGFIAFARNGNMLSRSILDLSVISPERLIFEAEPILSEGLSKAPREWVHCEGAPLAGDFSLSADEIASFERLVQAASQDPAAIAQSQSLADAYDERLVQKLAATAGISASQARQQIPKRSPAPLGRTEHVLYPSDVIDVHDYQLSVRELLERGPEFDGVSIPDPVEGRSYGQGTAMFYYNRGNSPCIHSFAHGLRTVYVISEFDVTETVVIVPDECTVSTVAGPPLIDNVGPLEPSDFPNIQRLKNDQIKLPTTIPNVGHLLRSYDISVRSNCISKKLLINIPGMVAAPDNYVNTAMDHILSVAALNRLNLQNIPAFISSIGERNQINPIAEWILGESWDGCDRLPALYSTLTESEDYPPGLKDILIYRWLLSAVAAALIPRGFHARGVLTLQSPQSMGKTQWIRSLVPDPMIRAQYVKIDHHLDPSQKDSVITAISHWVVELGEIDSSFRKDIARLKGFITADTDKLRRPYARGNSEYQRRTVFCASVNDINFLVDSTGNTRFWTIPLVNINYAHDVDMRQVWAQVAVAFNQGAEWWLSKDEEALLETHNRKHRSVSAIRELLTSKFVWDMPEQDWLFCSPIEVLRVFGIRLPGNRQCKECADFLREHFGPERKRNGKVGWLVPIRKDLFSID